MIKNLEQRLKKAGWKTGDAADFFGMTDERRSILDTRTAAIKKVRRGSGGCSRASLVAKGKRPGKRAAGK